MACSTKASVECLLDTKSRETEKWNLKNGRYTKSTLYNPVSVAHFRLALAAKLSMSKVTKQKSIIKFQLLLASYSTHRQCSNISILLSKWTVASLLYGLWWGHRCKNPSMKVPPASIQVRQVSTMQKPAFVCTYLFPAHELFMAQDSTRVFNHLRFHLGLILWCRTNYSMHRPDRRWRGRKMCQDVQESVLPMFWWCKIVQKLTEPRTVYLLGAAGHFCRLFACASPSHTQFQFARGWSERAPFEWAVMNVSVPQLGHAGCECLRFAVLCGCYK